MNFDPRPVPRSSWRRWLVEGLALSTRRVGAFVVFGALAALVHGAAALAGLGVVVVPLALGAGCLVAECADHGRSVLGALLAKPPRVALRLLAAGLVVATGFWLAGALVMAIALSAGIDPAAIPSLIPGGGDGGATGAASRGLVETLCAAWFLSVACVLFGASVAVGFLVPLLALAEAPLKESFTLALLATGRNDFVIFFVAGLALTALVGLVTPYLVVPWVAVVAATLYAGYRDVFLGRAENAPVRGGARAGAAAPINARG